LFGANYRVKVNELHKVTSWEELGQWCWERMLCLRRVWQTAPPIRMELPSAKLEESIDSCIRSMLRSPNDSLFAPEEDKPWILARLQFVSALLQPTNVQVLGLPKLCDPMDALRFLLLAEWFDSGREFWPLVCDAINDHGNAFSCEEGSLSREAKSRNEDVDRKRVFFGSISSCQLHARNCEPSPA